MRLTNTQPSRRCPSLSIVTHVIDSQRFVFVRSIQLLYTIVLKRTLTRRRRRRQRWRRGQRRRQRTRERDGNTEKEEVNEQQQLKKSKRMPQQNAIQMWNIELRNITQTQSNSIPTHTHTHTRAHTETQARATNVFWAPAIPIPLHLFQAAKRCKMKTSSTRSTDHQCQYSIERCDEWSNKPNSSRVGSRNFIQLFF